ncbi:glutamate synthase central domain-containing protein [Staphylococcus epidermidis]|uniref:glutamate synthase central domain-containing protein n=1 Tax=Staphylococcus epidermidis TaxID=1282 RepID=UPI0021B228CE|nr:glutamate synthase central domain-containing protein [Staphylococcus epidermidis]
MHELLIGEGLRMERRVIGESGERGEVDEVGCLVGYGGKGVVGYLGEGRIEQLRGEGEV